MKTNLLSIALLSAVATAAVAEEKTEFKPAESVNALAVDLYQQISTQEDGNLFFSPYSISSALAMTYGGARGETAAQMNKVLHFGGQDATHPAFSTLRTNLNAVEKKGDIQLSVANALWPQKDYSFRAEYLDLIKNYYASEIRPVDYATNKADARKQINTWVEEQTNEKIKDLIPEGALNELTRLVLVNAIYFKGNWASQFKSSDTHDAPFHLSRDKTVQVSMMSQKEHFRYAETGTFQAVELPYEGDDLSMLILLPSGTNTLAALETEFKADTLSSLRFRNQELIVQLPKFKLESSFGLGDTLQQMGMTDAFSRSSDLSGMDGTRKLFISSVIHKAFVEVNEEGTEAAAATGVVVGLRSMPRPPMVFTADHPFLFFIRDNASGTILFMGRMMNPKA
ncbi:MAG: serpin family protein [Pontiellaceae bacterium]|nr:serpin family protein [Pontiellaceae bacterium]